MPLYEITSQAFRPINQTSFMEQRVRERHDLQRLLRSQIGVLGDDLYVLTEEFGDWEDSRRRIDLLAIDQQANLVVIELKRTSDGGHMELQAIRYASMISAMTFERAVQIHGEFLTRMGEPGEGARARMLAFLNWEEPDEENFAPDVRIILVSEDFGKELTTAVLRLRDISTSDVFAFAHIRMVKPAWSMFSKSSPCRKPMNIKCNSGRRNKSAARSGQNATTCA